MRSSENYEFKMDMQSNALGLACGSLVLKLAPALWTSERLFLIGLFGPYRWLRETSVHCHLLSFINFCGHTCPPLATFGAVQCRILILMGQVCQAAQRLQCIVQMLRRGPKTSICSVGFFGYAKIDSLRLRE